MNLIVLKKERAKIEAQKIIKANLRDLVIKELKADIKREVEKDLHSHKVARIIKIKNSEI